MASHEAIRGQTVEQRYSESLFHPAGACAQNDPPLILVHINDAKPVIAREITNCENIPSPCTIPMDYVAHRTVPRRPWGPVRGCAPPEYDENFQLGLGRNRPVAPLLGLWPARGGLDSSRHKRLGQHYTAKIAPFTIS
jgi:hypothetical protein